MKLYYRNPGQTSEFVIDGAELELFLTLENDLGDGLSIVSKIDHIRMGARIRAVSEAGDTLFIGSIVSIEYGAAGGKRQYSVIAAEALLQCRYAPNIIYSGGVGLTLSDIFSSDAPPQGAGASQYAMGLLWLSRSKICDGTDAGLISWDSDGVGTLEGWGPLVSGHDIYYGGRLLAETVLSALSAETDSYVIQDGNLYIRGSGAGDVYDVVAADGWNENHVRLGTVATDSELDAPYNVAETETWTLIRDLVLETGQYIIFRQGGDGYVYLDVAASPKARGSEGSPFASLHIGDDFSLQKILQPRYLPHACVVGMGADSDEVTGQRYGAGALLDVGKAWIEASYQLSGAANSPSGNLDGATEDFFAAIHQDPPVEIALYREGHLPGDWLELDLGDGFTVCGQIRTIRKTSSGPDIATVGAPDLSLLTAYQERAESGAIEAYRDRSESIADGEAVRYGYFGATETFADDFETIDWGAESVPILLTLAVVDPDEIDEFSPSVFYNININGTIIKLPWQPWGPEPITDFDIGPYCYLDGTTNNISISIDDPAGWVPDDYLFELTISGLGANDPVAPMVLQPSCSILSDSSDATYYGTYSTSYQDYTCTLSDPPDIVVDPSVTIYARVYTLYGNIAVGYARTILVVGGTSYYGTVQSVSNSWKWISTTYTKSPKTGLPFTTSELNALSGGASIRVQYSGSYHARVSKVYVVVTP